MGDHRLLYAFFVLVQSQSAVHEIEAGVALIIATLSFGFAEVIHAVQKSATTEGEQ